MEAEVVKIPLIEKEFGERIVYYFDIGKHIIFEKNINVTAYKYFRLFCTHPQSNDNKIVNISEIKPIVTEDIFNYYEYLPNKCFNSKIKTDELKFEKTLDGLIVSIPGPHKFYFTLDGSVSNKSGGGYFIVRPLLTIGISNNDKSIVINDNQIVCQTLISKLLGSFHQWPSRIETTIQAGYNMIHFTPLQELGGSNSSYCIKDLLKVNNLFSSIEASNTEDLEKFMQCCGKSNFSGYLNGDLSNHKVSDKNSKEIVKNWFSKNGKYLKTDSQKSCFSSLTSSEILKCYKLGKPMQLDFEDIGIYLEHLRQVHGVLSITDVVLNHTAYDSEWLLEHPECAYNCKNSPYLKPSFLLDRILWKFNFDVSQGLYNDDSIYSDNITEDSLNHIRIILSRLIFDKYKIQDFFLINIDSVIENFIKLEKDKFNEHSVNWKDINYSDLVGIEIKQDLNYKRLTSSINIQTLINVILNKQIGSTTTSDHVQTDYSIHKFSSDLLKPYLCTIQSFNLQRITEYLNIAIENYIANVRWRFVNSHGPKYPTVTEKTPMQFCYFNVLSNPPKNKEEAEKYSVEYYEDIMEKSPEYIMANNGWIFNSNVLDNFADNGGLVYLKRELIPWGDNIKLRYGNGPKDCPYLYSKMKDYVTLTAKYFHGIRIDNCHSTPIHVAEYMIHCARVVRPNLYIVGELFTNDEGLDNMFINRLGINSVVRESINSTTLENICANISRIGGENVGSMFKTSNVMAKKYTPPAMFADQTHDNDPIMETFNLRHVLPTAAIVNFSNSAISSNRGFDELIQHHINVVSETRLYKRYLDLNNYILKFINIKHFMNKLHIIMCGSTEDMSQIFADNSITRGVIGIKRVCPITSRNFVLLAHIDLSSDKNYNKNKDITPKTDKNKEKFVPNYENSFYHMFYKSEYLDSTILFEGKLSYNNLSKDQTPEESLDLEGLSNFDLYSQYNLDINESLFVYSTKPEKVDNQFNRIPIHNFYPGSILMLQFNPIDSAVDAYALLRYEIQILECRSQYQQKSEIYDAIKDINLAQFNYVLYKCANEEANDGNYMYEVPRFGQFVFGGLQGIESVLKNIRENNLLNHPLCENLREGNWLLNFIVDRLQKKEHSILLANYLKEVFANLAKINRCDVPSYFSEIIRHVVIILNDKCLSLLNKSIRENGSFLRSLALCSIQLVGIVPSATLPIPESKYVFPEFESKVTMSAGLPHFSIGVFRVWGRDTCIALPGLLLKTGRVQEAFNILYSFAGTVQNGLIPNLMSSGNSHMRYNCRDAVWYWLYCIMRFDLQSESNSLKLMQNSFVRDAVQNVLQTHALGFSFIEKVGSDGTHKSIDINMQEGGFLIAGGINWNNGFVYGGNDLNCGTWMDKMGSSISSGNKGFPATPRDGSAVELVGLSYAVISWLAKSEFSSLNGVNRCVNGTTEFISFKQWADLIKVNFELLFYIPLEHEYTEDTGECISKYVNRKGIYKDSVDSTRIWSDYQLRPNFFITVVVAQELFDVERVFNCLIKCGKILYGPIGIKTLDPDDMAYNGNYNNWDTNSGFNTADGFNYHQGPEWIWVCGYYLQARLITAKNFSTLKNNFSHLEEAIFEVKLHLNRLEVEITNSSWISLPELTNKDGAFCRDGCRSQAWSVSTIIETILLLKDIESEHPDL